MIDTSLTWILYAVFFYWIQNIMDMWTHRFAETDHAEMSCHITKVLQCFNQAVHFCKSGNMQTSISVLYCFEYFTIYCVYFSNPCWSTCCLSNRPTAQWPLASQLLTHIHALTWLSYLKFEGTRESRHTFDFHEYV